MSKSLVVVESPAKAKTIQKILGRGFQVLSSMGHVKDLPKSRIGVDVEQGFAPTYVVIKERKKVLTEILETAREVDHVFLAPDPDREGEAIAWHIAEAIRGDAEKKAARKRKTAAPEEGTAAAGAKGRKKAKGKEPEKAPKPPTIQRVLFHEITKKGIEQGMHQPLELDRLRFDSQQARRILDRLVGYKLSPILWKKVRRGLSAGRVQSVAVKIVCDREKAIAAFVPEEYWSLEARFGAASPPPFAARLVEAGGRKVRPGSGPEAEELRRAVEKGPFVVSAVRKKTRRRSAPPPFTTSKLQQEASRSLRMQSFRTMMVAQGLYEGVEIPGAGLVGLITYMRTDSVRVADEALAAVRDHIRAAWGERFLPEAPNTFRNRKSAQDAHEAIRPTSMEYTPEKMKAILSRDAFRLYELIWKRFVASQMAPAEFDQTAVDIACVPADPPSPLSPFLFRASGSVPRFSGYLEAYQETAEPKEGAEGEGAEGEEGGDGPEGILPPLSEGEVLSLVELVPSQHFTQPPPRFSESALIKELEEQGIGRPSTYAAIVKTIKDRGYVKAAEGKFVPTELGTTVIDFLDRIFHKSVMDVAFTARMEEELDQVEDGERGFVETLTDFYGPFSVELKEAEETEGIKTGPVPTGLPCPACGKELVIRDGRMGRFLACEAYPECRYTSNFRETEDGRIEPEAPEEAGIDCDKCGRPMVVRNWKGARYIACSGYPECRNSRPFPTGIGCPECGTGELVERSSRFGRMFFSCSRYPDCKFAAWTRPVAHRCPECAFPAMAEKTRKGGERFLACLRKGCKGKVELPPSEAEGD
jgi:DNA topoisomerase-1